MAYERIEILGSVSFEDALDESLNQLEARGFGGSPNDPEVIIVHRTNGRVNFDLQKEVDTYVYIGATEADVSQDILSLT